MNHAANSFSGGSQQHIFNERPGRTVIHQTIAVLVLAQRVLLLVIGEDDAGGFLDHAALTRVSNLKHFLLRGLRLLNPAGIGTDKLSQLPYHSFIRQGEKFPSSLMIGRWSLQACVQNPLQHLSGNLPVLKLTDASSCVNDLIKFHLLFLRFLIYQHR